MPTEQSGRIGCARALDPNEEWRTYIFIRKDCWYPIELPPSSVTENAELNPGTLRVEDALTGEVVWRLQ